MKSNYLVSLLETCTGKSSLALKVRKGGRVLAYHGVISKKADFRLERNLHLASDFDKHLKLMNIIGVRAVTEMSKRMEGRVAITFDDGYANTLIAAELLARYRFSWTLFISTNAIGREKTIWTVELSLLILYGSAAKIEVLEKKWDLTLREQRERAFQEIRTVLKGLPADMKNKMMSNIREQFPSGESQRLLEKFPSFKMLTWNEVRQLAAAGVEIGSHGVNHEIHHKNQPIEVRMSELIDSKLEIERQIGKPCRLFAYPNGNFAATSSQEAQKAGYELAFTTQQGTLVRETNPYLIPRIQPVSSLCGFIRDYYLESK